MAAGTPRERYIYPARSKAVLHFLVDWVTFLRISNHFLFFQSAMT
jgi:hypothetical protein